MQYGIKGASSAKLTGDESDQIFFFNVESSNSTRGLDSFMTWKAVYMTSFDPNFYLTLMCLRHAWIALNFNG